MNDIKPKEQKALNQAKLYLSQNNAIAARDTLLEYSRKNKLGQYTKHLLCLSFAISGNPGKAKELATQLVKDHPNHIEYLKLLGSCNHDLKNYDDAIKYFTRAIAINNSDFQSLSNIASSLKEIQQYDEAEKYFTLSLQINPGQPDALTNLGLLMQIHSKTDEAINLHKKALQLAPYHLHALYNLAFVLNETNNKDGALNCYKLLLQRSPDHIKALCDTSRIYADAKQIDKALELLNHAETLEPNNEDVLQNLGTVYKILENKEKAMQYFLKILAINPNNQAVRYFIAMMNGDTEFTASPETYVQGLFDSYATTFDQHLVGKLKYHTPELVSDLIRKNLKTPNKLNILDLGCGTGLVGMYLNDIAATMTGVDLSPKMIEKAKEKNIYTRLIVAGIKEYLESISDQPDIVISSDVFVYFGDLQEIFSLVAKNIQPEGLFAFSTEGDNTTETYSLKETGRFTHNPNYIKELAKSNGFTVDELQETVIRYEAEKPVNGHVYILSHP